MNKCVAKESKYSLLPKKSQRIFKNQIFKSSLAHQNISKLSRNFFLIVCIFFVLLRCFSFGLKNDGQFDEFMSGNVIHVENKIFDYCFPSIFYLCLSYIAHNKKYY